MRLSYFQVLLLSGELRRRRVVLSEMFQVILDLDAHHQMRPAFKIESEMNVVRQRRFDARVGEVFEVRPAPVRSNYDVKAGQGNNPDDDRTLKEIFPLHELLGAA